MKKLFMTLVGLVVFGISAFSQLGAAPAAKKDELPQTTMTMCDGKMGANCPMGNAGAAQATDTNGQAAPPAQCTMGTNCPMGDARMAAGQCKMTDGKCEMDCMKQSMLDVMKMQKKIVAGVPAAQKKKMIAEIDKKISEMQAMMGNMQKMPMPCTSPMPCEKPVAPVAPQAPTK
jgi:hypothetical protein